MIRNISHLLTLALITAISSLISMSISHAATMDTDEPIEITADKLEVQQDNQLAIFTGNVVAIQGKMTMKSAIMRVYYRENAQTGDNEIFKIDAATNVSFDSKAEQAFGEKALYLIDKKTLYLTENVKLKRETNTLYGDKLEYNVATGRSILTGGGKNTSKTTPSQSPDSGRVKGIFVPKKAE